MKSGSLRAIPCPPKVTTACGTSTLMTMRRPSPRGLGRRIVINVDVPQAVVTFGGQGIARNDPDFMAAYIVNHILGGGSFSSRLYKEVREKLSLIHISEPRDRQKS